MDSLASRKRLLLEPASLSLHGDDGMPAERRSGLRADVRRGDIHRKCLAFGSYFIFLPSLFKLVTY